MIWCLLIALCPCMSPSALQHLVVILPLLFQRYKINCLCLRPQRWPELFLIILESYLTICSAAKKKGPNILYCKYKQTSLIHSNAQPMHINFEPKAFAGCIDQPIEPYWPKSSLSTVISMMVWSPFGAKNIDYIFIPLKGIKICLVQIRYSYVGIA